MKPKHTRAAADRDALRRTIETALPVAVERAKLLDEIRAALDNGDEARACRLMRRYVGLVQESQAA